MTMSPDALDAAIEAIKRELEATPDRPELWYSLANQLSQARRHGEAALAWQRAAALDTSSHRSIAMFNGGNEFLASGDPRGALHGYLEAWKHGMDSPGVLINGALALARGRGATRTSSADLLRIDESVEAITHTSGCWAALAEWRRQTLGNSEKAAAAFQRAAELDPDANYGEWWAQAAGCLIEVGALEAAQAAWQRSLAINPKPGLLSVECELAAATGGGDAALERWRGLTNRNTDGITVALLSRLGRHQAADDLAKAILANPDTFAAIRRTVILNWSKALLDRGQPELAWEQLQTLDSEDDALQILRARTLVTLGRIDDAFAHVQSWRDSGALAPPEVRLLVALCAIERPAEPPAEFPRIDIDGIEPKPRWFVELARGRLPSSTT